MSICSAQNWYAVFNTPDGQQSVPLAYWWDGESLAAGFVPRIDVEAITEEFPRQLQPDIRGRRPHLVSAEAYKSFSHYAHLDK